MRNGEWGMKRNATDECRDDRSAESRRVCSPFVLLCAGLLMAAGCQRARTTTDTGFRIELDANKRAHVRVGFPGGTSGQESGRSRNGAWTPVYVKLKAGKQAVPRNAYRLVVETTDSEDSPFRYISSVPDRALQPDEDFFAVTYSRPGSGGSEFRITLETADGQLVQSAGTLRDAGREV